MDSAYLSQASSIDQQQQQNQQQKYQQQSIVSLPGGPSSKPLTGRRRASMFDPIDPADLQKTLYNENNNTNNVIIFFDNLS
jgi:hypothetical protein